MPENGAQLQPLRVPPGAGMGRRMIIGLEPTRHCNLRCIHCLRDDTATFQEMPIEFVEKVLSQAHVYGLPHIAMTGGEPTLHRRFYDILDVVRRHGFTCHFVTNGRTLGKMLPRLATYNDILSYISFSIDGATEHTHDTIRGKGSYRSLKESILLCYRYGFMATLQLVVNKLNRAELHRLPDLCRHLGVKHLYISHAMPTPDLYGADLQLAPDEWLEVEAEVRRLSSANQDLTLQLAEGVYDPANPAPCQALKHQSLNIDHSGRLTMCCLLSGVSGDAHVDDVVCDLNEVSLQEGHRRVIARAAQVVSDRIRAFNEPESDPLDAFQCWHCTKFFGKTDWMSAYPDDPWAQRANAHRRRSAAQTRLAVPDPELFES